MDCPGVIPMKSRWLILLFLFLLNTLCVAAFEVSSTAEASIYANETAEYTITIVNSGDSSEKLELNLELDSKWSFETDPQSYLSSFTVDTQETLSFTLRITPTSEYVSSGKYALTIPITSETGEQEFVDLVLYIKNPNALTGYLPSLNFVLDSQEQIDPRQVQKVKLTIINRNPLDITDMQVILNSDLYNETKTATLGPLETTTVLFEINYDPKQQPTTDTLILTVVVDEKVFTPIKKEIEIIAYADIAQIQYPTKKFLFKTTQTTEYTNNGNSDTTKEIKYLTSEWERYFTGGVPQGVVEEEEGLFYYKTNAVLPVGVPVEVTYTVSYRPILYVVLLIIVCIGLYYLFRSPLTIKKEVMTMHVGKDGKTKLKILLHIKNRSIHMLDSVEVTDKIPALAEIEKHFEVGTMKPERILKHEKAGTVLEWKIPHLEAYEERIITYKVESMYQIVGSFQLPATVVKFKDKKHTEKKVVSNKVHVGKKAEEE